MVSAQLILELVLERTFVDTYRDYGLLILNVYSFEQKLYMIYILTRLEWLPVYKIISMIIIERKYEAPRRRNIYLRDFPVMIGSRTPLLQ